MDNNSSTRIPSHLRQYIVDQQYDKYTWRDQAVWRYVMHRNIDFLPKVAHDSYLTGLKKTGISIEKIPSLLEMNAILKNIGWSAVCVSGFIPPEAFMEFQANKILVIAADIRHLEHIEYTPAPDILHEAAGHAPIIANEAYAKYLEEFGKIGTRAFSSAKDHQIYKAIRELSDLKAKPNANPARMKELELKISKLEEHIGNPSEMSLLRNLHWWTVEYGLIGAMKSPKIYGAGLLSSIAESQYAMSSKVKKLKYSIEAMHYGFDITKMQPHLFVTPSFEHLNVVLMQFQEQMAQKKGGTEGLLKAVNSRHIATCELSSGIQISGVFSEYILDGADLVYIKTQGPTELGFGNALLPGHDKEYHADGFGSPIGKLKNCNKPIRFLDDEDLNTLEIVIGQFTQIEFLSGLLVKGVLTHILKQDGRILLLSFEECEVKYKDKVLFQPEWGIFDMAVGEQLTSIYSGQGFNNEKTSVENHARRSRQANLIPAQLNSFYLMVRKWRTENAALPDIVPMLEELKKLDKNDWLLAFELLQIARNNCDADKEKYLIDYLHTFPEKYWHMYP